MTPVRFGLVGYGFGGRWFHAPFIAASSACSLTAVMTSSPDRRALVESDHPGTPTVESLEALVDLGVNAVAISTPADTHSALTDSALEKGLAVVCDKPFALDPEAARRSVELAEQLGLALSPFQNRRWDSDFLTVRRLLDNGTLGTIVQFESRFERYAPQNGPGQSGAGTLLDFGSHLVDQALHLLGPVTQVFAHWRTRQNGLDDDVFVALVHASGARSHLSGSWQQFAPGPRFRVTGTEATVVLTDGDTQEVALIGGGSPSAANDTTWGVETHSRGHLYTASGVSDVVTERGRWDTYYPAFAAAVRGDGAVPVAARDAIASALVLGAAKRSATTGTVVTL